MVHDVPLPPKPKARPRILLLSLLPIGDTIFTIPAIRALRARYPAAHITALVHATTAPLYRCIPDVDDAVVLPFRDDWQGVRPFARTLQALRACRFDVSVDFTTPAYKWVNFYCTIPTRRYMRFEPLWWIIPRDRARWRATHACRHMYDCAHDLGLPPWDEVDHAPRLSVPESARAEAHALLREQRQLGPAGPLVGMHQGGEGLDGLKRWPADRFAELARRLQWSQGARIVLLGGPEDAGPARQAAASMPRPPIVATGSLSLPGSVAVVEACDLFIGNDSSLLHAAAAVGTPFVGIYGPTSVASFHPVGIARGQGAIVQPEVPCPEQRHFVGGDVVWKRPRCRGVCKALATVSVDAVAACAERIVRQGAGERLIGAAIAAPEQRLSEVHAVVEP